MADIPWVGCDRCVARALFVSTMDSGLKLYFCGHHATKYESTNPVTIKQTADA